jgi:CspA family cold shock protein
MDEVTMEEQLKINENYGEYIGYVKWFNIKKGYGFITITDGGHQGEDVFCHFSDIATDNYKIVYPGEFVSCNVETKKDDSKLICKNVTGVNGYPLLADNPKYMYKIVPKNRQSSA